MRCKHCQRVIIMRKGKDKWTTLRKVPISAFPNPPLQWGAGRWQTMDCPKKEDWSYRNIESHTVYDWHEPEPEIVSYVREVLRG